LDLIRDLLRQPTFGLITDVDGTISRTAPTPQQAKVSPLCHHYLSILRPHLAVVAAISGRPAVEVKNMIGIDGMVYIGNYGLERWVDGRSELSEEPKITPGLSKLLLNN
ncbi:trehalose-phosphatase, partial [Chloroflexota bacterium]